MCGAVARKAGGETTTTVRHAKVVAAVCLLRTKMVQVVRNGRTEFVRADDVLPTPGNNRGREKGVKGGAHREPGSDGHQPRQQDLFLTCGDPAGTLPCVCPFDRGHPARHGSLLGVRGGDSVARRYPACLLNVRGYSIDAQADALFEMQQRLMSDGLEVYGGGGDIHQRDQLEQEWRNRVFAHRDEQSVKRMLRRAGLSKVTKGI